MEDAARFVLDDAKLTAELKQLRHDLVETLRPMANVPLFRYTDKDVGTSISTESEQQRDSITDVAAAAGKRLSEALRCLEEYSKIEHGLISPSIEALRYRGYELEGKLLSRFYVPGPSPASWRVCVLISESLCTHQNWFDVAAVAITKGGASCIQLREKNLPDCELLARARQLTRFASRSERVSVIINDRPDIALLAGADGVHLGQTDLTPDDVRQIAGRRLLIGVSTHNMDEAKRAIDAGADYCGVGAVFATDTKARKPSGLDYIREFVKEYPLQPHLAIGGINLDNVAEVVNAGAQAVAVSSCVCGADNPGAIVRLLERALPRRTEAQRKSG